MAAYRRVYDSRHLHADCQEPGSAPGPYARQSSMGYLFYLLCCVTADDGSLRLVGGDEISGRLEVYTEDEWKTVCSRQWTAVNTRYCFIYFLIFNIIGKGGKPLTCR